jgi:L,D-transpeptidase catalytic domain
MMHTTNHRWDAVMRFRQFCFAVFAVVVGVAAMPNLSLAKLLEVNINKASQKMTVKVDGVTEYVWLVSTGAASYDTPSGQYKPFRLEEDHFSKEWDDAPMPHAIFFTPRGHAIHGSYSIKSLGRKASHGCVRLHPDNAAILFDLVQEAGLGNTKVSIKGGFFDVGNGSEKLASSTGEYRRSKPWFLFGSSSKKNKTTRSFASVNDDITKTTTKKPVAKKVVVKKVVVKKDKPKKVAKKVELKCTTKDGKKTCKKPFNLFSTDNS